MTIEEKVYAVLGADQALALAIPKARIKVPGDWQNLARPYIVHFPVSLQPTRTHDGLRKLRIWDYYQVSVVADTYSSGRAICELVVAALDGVRDDVHFIWRPGAIYVGRNDEIGVEEFALNFRIAEAL